MNEIPETILRQSIRCYDRLWRRLHRVRPIDALLSLSVEPYRGNAETLPEGIRLERGDRLGILHFNHECFAETDTGGEGNRRAALLFRRRLFQSLRRLARCAAEDPDLGRIQAYYGVNWMRPHGERLGFVVQRLPDGFTTRLRIMHFRMLLWAFFPRLAEREHERLHPHAFWLMRDELIANFSGSSERGILDRAETR